MTTVPVNVQERLPLPPAMVRRPAPASNAGGISFGDVVRILKQRIFMILFLWIFATGATAGLTFYLQKYHQKFTAVAMIQIDYEGPRDPLRVESAPVAVEMMNRRVADQIQYLMQDRVLTDAIEDSAIRATDWYADARIEEKSGDPIIESLKKGLGASQVPNTSYLQVSFSARNRQDAEKIVNTLVEKYTKRQQVASKTELNQQLMKYTEELKQLESTLDQVRGEKERYVGEMINEPGVTRHIEVAAEQWRALAVEATRLEAESLQLRAASQNMKDIPADQIALSPTLQINIQQDPSVLAINNALMGIEQEYQSTLGRVGPNHRMVQILAAQKKSAEDQRDKIIHEKEAQIRQFQLTSAETAYLNALQAKLALDERVAEFQAKQHDLDAKMARVGSMDDRQELLTKQYELLSNFVQQLRLLVTSQDTVRIRTTDAVASPRPSFPKWELFMPVGSFLGLLSGIGLALLLEVASTSIHTPRDLVRHVHIPILGTVPDLDDEEVAIDRIELASHTAPRSMVAEAFRSIRTNLLLSSPAERQRTVLITSAKPEEGKTSVAVNLAIAIGQSGRRVLLVDANFHRPTLHTLFPKAHREGLSNILIGRGQLQDLASPTELPNLDVLTCGPIPPNPTELLSSRYLAEMISQAAGQYDQVLFDGPPSLLVSDALVLATVVDGVIMVCRAKATSRGTIQRAREQLERVNARIFGAVLNAAQVARGGYFREQMRSYYDYQPEEALLAGSTRALPAEKPDEPEEGGSRA